MAFFRYKVYLEPEEDNRKESNPRIPLSEMVTPSIHTSLKKKPRSVSTNPTARRKSEGSSLQQNRKFEAPSSTLRMGTRVPISALHRERLRTDLTTKFFPQKPNLDLDFDTMEYKSILPDKSTAFVASVVEADTMPYSDPGNESLSESLMERFDNMETDLPEKQIVPVTVQKQNGRLGLKVTGHSSGIYVDEFDVRNVKQPGYSFKKGDRIVAINGRSLENVKYENALEMMRKSQNDVQFLVSQIRE